MVRVWAPRKSSLAYTPRVRSKSLIPTLKISTSRKFMLGIKVGSMKYKDANNLTENCSVFEIPEFKIKSYNLYLKKKGLTNKIMLQKYGEKNENELTEAHFKDYKVSANLVFNFEVIKGISRKKEVIREVFTKSIINYQDYLEEFANKEKLMQKAVTIGQGFSGIVKRMGVKLKKRTHSRANKTRLPGAVSTRGLGRIPSSSPNAGQLGCFMRTITNMKNVTKFVCKQNSNLIFKNYGPIDFSKNKILALKGSSLGPIKRISVIYYE